MKYEALIEDYHGHFSRARFEANSDEEAIKIAEKDWDFGAFGDDALWRVEKEYVNHSHFDAEEQRKMKEEYIRIKT